VVFSLTKIFSPTVYHSFNSSSSGAMWQSPRTDIRESASRVSARITVELVSMPGVR